MDNTIRRVQLLGHDIIFVKDPKHIKDIAKLEEADRVSAVVENFDELPWLFRRFFSRTRFYNPDLKGWFLPFCTSSDSRYATCKEFMERCVSQTRDISSLVKDTADLLANTHRRATDEELGSLAARAVWSYMVPPDHPPVPQELLTAASKHINGISGCLLPWKFIPAEGIAAVFKYADDTLSSLGLRGLGGLPDAAVSDFVHPLLSLPALAPAVLRRIAEFRDSETVEKILCDIGPTENTTRMVHTESTLGGLLEDGNPAVPKKTVIVLNIRAAAQETGDISFVYGVGLNHRLCIGRDVITNYFQEVQDELRCRKVD